METQCEQNMETRNQIMTGALGLRGQDKKSLMKNQRHAAGIEQQNKSQAAAFTGAAPDLERTTTEGSTPTKNW
jgi:hypothetical protein